MTVNDIMDAALRWLDNNRHLLPEDADSTTLIKIYVDAAVKIQGY